VPRIDSLPKGEPVEEVFALLAEEPDGSFLHTEVPPEAEVVQEAEPQEGELVIDLNEEFWSGDAESIRTRVAQFVFTLSGLEEGRSITLLKGAAPARVPGPNGAPMPQPFSAEDFPDPRPLIQIAQPPPGATVPPKVPVKVIVPKGAQAWGIISLDEHLGSKTKLKNGGGMLDSGVQGTRRAKIVFVVLRGEDRASVSVPITISG
jgi:hypothetical protein